MVWRAGEAASFLKGTCRLRLFQGLREQVPLGPRVLQVQEAGPRVLQVPWVPLGQQAFKVRPEQRELLAPSEPQEPRELLAPSEQREPRAQLALSEQREPRVQLAR